MHNRQKYNISFLLGLLALAFCRLDAMEQFSGVIERVKNYSPYYLAAPIISWEQYNYRKNIPIEQRYLNPSTAYFGPAAASTLASTLLNRNSGWSSALGWALLKNIPAWASAGVCYRNEITDDKVTKNHKEQEQAQHKNLLAKQKFIDRFLNTIDSNIRKSLSTHDLAKPMEDINFIRNHIELSRIISLDQKNDYLNKVNELNRILSNQRERIAQNKEASAEISALKHPNQTQLTPALLPDYPHADILRRNPQELTPAEHIKIIDNNIEYRSKRSGLNILASIEHLIKPLEPYITPPYQNNPSTLPEGLSLDDLIHFGHSYLDAVATMPQQNLPPYQRQLKSVYFNVIENGLIKYILDQIEAHNIPYKEEAKTRLLDHFKEARAFVTGKEIKE